MKRLVNSLAAALATATLAATFAAPAFAQGSSAAQLVPQEVRARGVLRVGSQQTFPPVEFREPGKTEAVGVSRDLLEEVTRRLGLKLEYLQAEYASLISGVEADRFDVASGGISSLADIAALRALTGEGIEGAIVGKALYNGNFTLPQALDIAGRR